MATPTLPLSPFPQPQTFTERILAIVDRHNRQQKGNARQKRQPRLLRPVIKRRPVTFKSHWGKTYSLRRDARLRP